MKQFNDVYMPFQEIADRYQNNTGFNLKAVNDVDYGKARTRKGIEKKIRQSGKYKQITFGLEIKEGDKTNYYPMTGFVKSSTGHLKDF